eukprot:361329-Chlamydomonas_euryale.AAC.2
MGMHRVPRRSPPRAPELALPDRRDGSKPLRFGLAGEVGQSVEQLIDRLYFWLTRPRAAIARWPRRRLRRCALGRGRPRLWCRSDVASALCGGERRWVKDGLTRHGCVRGHASDGTAQMHVPQGCIVYVVKR